MTPRPDVDPVGLAEVAERLGVQRRTVDRWRERGVLPAPDWTVGGRPAWDWSTIEAWARATGRLPAKDRGGRPAGPTSSGSRPSGQTRKVPEPGA